MSATITKESIIDGGIELDRSDWELVSFGDVALKQRESVDRENTDLTRYVAGEHMGSEDLHLRKWGELSEDYLGPAFTRKFSEGDILYGSRRTYLRKVAVAHFDGITANTTFVIKPNEEMILKELLPFVMLSEGFTQHSIRNSKGSVNPYINWKDIANYEFLLPPKDQQAKLAELLWAADEQSEAQKRTKNKHELALKSFVHDRVLENPGAVEMQLNDVVESMKGGKSPVCKNENYVPCTPGILKTSAVTSGRFVSSEAKTIKPKDLDSLSVTVEADSILINRKNTRELVGVSCYTTESHPHLYLSDLIWQIRPNEKILAKYLFYILSSSRVRNRFAAISNGTSTSMVNIAKGNVVKLRISVPVLNEQKAILAEIEQFESSGQQLETSLAGSQQLLKSLINHIF